MKTLVVFAVNFASSDGSAITRLKMSHPCGHGPSLHEVLLTFLQCYLRAVVGIRHRRDEALSHYALFKYKLQRLVPSCSDALSKPL